jgi:hypothetical protein
VALTAVVAGVMASGAIVWRASEAAFSGVTTNPSNSWAAGKVELRDDDGGGSNPLTGTAMFTATGIKPSATYISAATKCIRLTYHGTIAGSTVKMYGSNLSGTLDDEVLLKIEIGNGGTYADCTGFVASSQLVEDVSLEDFAGTYSSYSNGLNCWWAPAAAAEHRTLRIAYRLSTGVADSLQGATAGMSFVWETQST